MFQSVPHKAAVNLNAFLDELRPIQHGMSPCEPGWSTPTADAIDVAIKHVPAVSDDRCIFIIRLDVAGAAGAKCTFERHIVFINSVVLSLVFSAASTFWPIIPTLIDQHDSASARTDGEHVSVNA